MNNTYLKFERRSETMSRFGLSKTTFYERINDGLIPPAINLGGRATGWLEHETQAVLAAMVAGKSKEEIRELVSELVNLRSQAA